MTAFILFIIGVYGGVHVYAFLKARQAFGFGWAASGALAAFMFVMVAAVFLIRLLERHEFELTARALSYVAYIWMALLFLFFCGSLVLDVANFALRVPGWLGAPASFFPAIPPRVSFILSFAVASVICLYGYFDAQNIRIEHMVVKTDRMPAGTDRLTLVQISDVHLGLIMRCDRLVDILAKVKEAKPDILVSTGDLVDAQINHLPGLRELLQDINAKYGKYAVTGNHEYYAGIEKSLEFTRRAGFIMLRGGSRDVGPIVIAGVDDRTAVQVHEPKPVPDREALAGTDRTKKFVLFLKHQPVPDPDAIGLFDLMLSGHTHKGQIWPFTLLVRRTYPLIAGRYDVGKGSIVYTSRGSGTWGPPIRFLSPPEVTVIELVRKK
jgi:predicted MPP superfamily phosphohydrolase